MRLADVNGDGLQDAVVDSGGKINVRLNLGGSFSGLYPTTYNGADLPAAQVLDYNSDGRQDLLVPLSDGEWHAMLAWKDGRNFDRIATNIPRTGYDDRPQVGDFDGDGLPDIALAFNNVWNLRFHKPGQPNLMTSINPGDRRFDDVITIHYQPLTNSNFKPFGDETPLYTMGNRIQCAEALLCDTCGIIAPI